MISTRERRGPEIWLPSDRGKLKVQRLTRHETIDEEESDDNQLTPPWPPKVSHP